MVSPPSLTALRRHELSALAQQHWAFAASQERPPTVAPQFDAKLVQTLYNDFVCVLPSQDESEDTSSDAVNGVAVLELSGYLPFYLWRYYDANSTSEHVLSMVFMLNEKARQNLPVWDCFGSGRNDDFAEFLIRATNVSSEKELSIHERLAVTVFLISCFQSLEHPIVRKCCFRLVSLALWKHIPAPALRLHLEDNAAMKPYFEALSVDQDSVEVTFMRDRTQEFIDELQKANLGDLVSIRFCERFLELNIDLLCQLPTRRFYLAFLKHSLVLEHACSSALYRSESAGALFRRQVALLKRYRVFGVDDSNGRSLPEAEVRRRHYHQVQILQHIAFKYFLPELSDLAFSNIASIDTCESLLRHLQPLDTPRLRELCVRLRLLGEDAAAAVASRDVLEQVLVIQFERHRSQRAAVHQLPLYPTEELLFDESVTGPRHYSGKHSLALPKLYMQVLSLHDYLLRCFDLYRLESSAAIRDELQRAVSRLHAQPHPDGSGATVFTGWSRMAIPLSSIAITKVGEPLLGQSKPSEVTAELGVDLEPFSGDVRREWEEIQRRDVLFLVSVSAERGIVLVRGCQVEMVLDCSRRAVGERLEDGQARVGIGSKRTYKVLLDTAQYELDVANDENDVYASMNLLLRRRPKQNNFKAVLECLCSLMHRDVQLPKWLSEVFLGYGHPGAATGEADTLDLHYSCVDVEHLKECFPEVELEEGAKPPFRLRYEDAMQLENDEDKLPSDETGTPNIAAAKGHRRVLASSYWLPSTPYYGVDSFNKLRFTPKQLEAITAGMKPGLSLCVGPPGTGKTDVAVQLMVNLYHQFPSQRLLLVTHSNHALNDLFEKLSKRDLDLTCMVRLGHGHSALNCGHDFSKFGRVNALLERRLSLLSEVGRLACTLSIAEDVAYTCDTASHFFLTQVRPRWSAFLAAAPSAESSTALADAFPFRLFFSNTEFSDDSTDEVVQVASACMGHLERLFHQLSECRPLEVLRTPRDRARYLLNKHARIVAMTCTHAALQSDELGRGFTFDTMVMEEAGQVLDVETAIPLLLQEADSEFGHRLQRVVLIGDDRQLPPIVQNQALQRFSHLDQSLFARLLRLGVPATLLDQQGRSRPSLANLYRWRYPALHDLVSPLAKAPAIAGLRYEFQFIDVADYEGDGETAPQPFFYQNLGEAEYLVQLYMYLRLCGHSAESIAVLTSYSGQKHLLRDVLRARCQPLANIGLPAKITTVDRFQGQQSPIVLLSLVRTKHVGHIRDVRRLVVALSRARLGLYVFGRAALFRECFELAPTMARLSVHPLQLTLVPGETCPCTRRLEDTPKTSTQVKDVVEMGQIVYKMMQ